SIKGRKMKNHTMMCGFLIGNYLFSDTTSSSLIRMPSFFARLFSSTTHTLAEQGNFFYLI
ncbi:hypothetical protein, partial [Peribacillus simplex]|uniref:hypothetical protein n=1 Tax=Peribacillus simplex TaxID=1478 RepID=UPI003D0817E8